LEEAYTLKCEKCSANLHYDIDKKLWLCEYCQTEYKFDDFSSTENVATSTYVDKYTCSNCGAEIIVDENTSATSCIYCGNSAILLDRISDIAAPEKIIPFKINKENAVELFKKRTRNIIFAKKYLIDIEENMTINGVYTPFWLYSEQVSGWKSWGQNESIDIKCEIELDKLPIDGIRSLANKQVQKIEPYNFDECEEFKKEYLSGFYADRYDFNSQSGIETLNEKMRKKLEEKIDWKVAKNISIKILVLLIFACIFAGYASSLSGFLLLFSAINFVLIWICIKGLSYFYQDSNMRFFYLTSERKLVLLPVYIIKIKSKDKKHIYLMNGQTGKLSHEISFSKKRLNKYRHNIKITSKIKYFKFLLDTLNQWWRRK